MLWRIAAMHFGRATFLETPHRMSIALTVPLHALPFNLVNTCRLLTPVSRYYTQAVHWNTPGHDRHRSHTHRLENLRTQGYNLLYSHVSSHNPHRPPSRTLCLLQMPMQTRKRMWRNDHFPNHALHQHLAQLAQSWELLPPSTQATCYVVRISLFQTTSR